MKNMCEKLCEENIKVFITHGNHDPLDHNFQSLVMPQNVYIFSDEVQTIPLEKDGEVIAYIHGISHASKKETKNLSQLFPNITEKMKEDAFHICMLHTSLMKSDGESIYAPCTIADLKEKNPHYWALGHIHKYQIVETNPLIVFPGALQGAHINEEEAHGAVLVEMTRAENSKQANIQSSFHALAPLFWKKIEFEMDNPKYLQNEVNLDENSENEFDYYKNKTDIFQDIVTLQSALHDELAEFASTLPPCTKQAIVKIILIKDTILNKKLRNIYTIQELIDSLNEQTQTFRPAIFVKEIEVATTEALQEKNIDVLIENDDFLAQVLREGQALLSSIHSNIRQDEDVNKRDFIEEDSSAFLALQAMYHDSPILKQHKKYIPMPTDVSTLQNIIKKAQYICAETLENE